MMYQDKDTASIELVIPADPLAETAAHHLLEVTAFQPRQLFGEHGNALAIGARHAGDVGAPEETVGPVGVENAAQPVMQVLERVRMGGIARCAGCLDGDVG